MNRRDFLKGSLLMPIASGLTLAAEDPERLLPWSVVGDVQQTRAVIAAGGLGAGTLQVQWSANRSKLETKVVGSQAHQGNDHVGRAVLTGLPAGSTIRYSARVGSRFVRGQFRTAPRDSQGEVSFLWGGDVVGQGWGIDPSHQGMLTFRSMQRENPDFFIHCGDSIYADDPLSGQVTLRGGGRWTNLVTNSKSKVAKELDDFYGNYRYNFLDRHYRDFFARVPVVAQWDDHEVVDNWAQATHQTLAAKAFQAFTTYWPVDDRPQAGSLYRKLSYGPNLDLFVLDLRSFRAPNGENRQTKAGPDSAMLGAKQLAWFKQGLAQSKATWKIVAGEMPLSTLTPRFGLDNWSNGAGPPLGREHELADILGFIKSGQIRNVVWLAADVHYAAAYHYHPDRAAYKSFSPFWEFIAGPLHAGTFPPTYPLDSTFGPREMFCAVPRDLPPNQPPSTDLQFYGKGLATRDRLRITLHQRQGKEVYRLTLPAE